MTRFSRIAAVAALALSAGFSTPSPAAPANGQAILDSAAALRTVQEVGLVCPWTCAEYKTTIYGPHCVKRIQNCHLTNEPRLRPPPARKTPG